LDFKFTTANDDSYGVVALKLGVQSLEIVLKAEVYSYLLQEFNT
jgi:hypothetical protein